MADKPKRKGTAFWFPDSLGGLLHAVAHAEDRTLPTVLARALQIYASTSPEYQNALSLSQESKDGEISTEESSGSDLPGKAARAPSGIEKPKCVRGSFGFRARN
jgi:hypothetical protein